MEQNLSPRRIYMQKKEEKHSNEEIMEAFDNSFSVCFALAQDRSPTARSRLFGQLWAANPDALIVPMDLVVFKATPEAGFGQYLVINRNTNNAGHDRMMELLKESGVVPNAWCFLIGRHKGYKCCYRLNLENDRYSYTHKAALLQDGEHLLMTVRNLAKADREILFPKK